MTRVAAIDIGSNAMRLVIGEFDKTGKLDIVHNSREAVRLGHDVFSTGRLSRPTLDAASAAIHRFHHTIRHFQVERVRAVATSAMRDAENGALLIQRVKRATGLEIEVIGGEEEARLIHLAVSKRINLSRKTALLIDIGGGSVECTVVDGGNVVLSESAKMGTVRLLEMMEGPGRDLRVIKRLVSQYGIRLKRQLARKKAFSNFQAIGTGGNIETFGDLRATVCKKSGSNAISSRELDTILQDLSRTKYEDRIRRFGLRPDRADVIVPAGILLQAILKEAGAKELLIPRVGLKEGVLFDLVLNLDEPRGTQPLRKRPDQVFAFAVELGRKYAFDESHAETVARIAVDLYDALKRDHGLNGNDRVLLKLAALLHDIGQFVDSDDHHKHTAYLIRETPFVGLTKRDRSIVAAVARYHRGSEPSEQHDLFASLDRSDRMRVVRLAGLLRIANALDKEHTGHVRSIRARRRGKKIHLEIGGRGAMMVERWAFADARKPLARVLRKSIEWA